MKPKVIKPSLKQRIEIAAFALFAEHGIVSVSVDAIAEAANTNKTGVYRNFGSKEALIEAWLGSTIQSYGSLLDELELKYPTDPKSQLRGFANLIVQGLPIIADRGCPFVNTLAEIGEGDHPISKRIIAHKRRQANRLTTLCRNANLSTPEIKAAHLTFVLEGAQISAQNGSIDDISATVLTVVESVISA